MVMTIYPACWPPCHKESVPEPLAGPPGNMVATRRRIRRESWRLQASEDRLKGDDDRSHVERGTAPEPRDDASVARQSAATAPRLAPGTAASSCWSHTAGVARPGAKLKPCHAHGQTAARCSPAIRAGRTSLIRSTMSSCTLPSTTTAKLQHRRRKKWCRACRAWLRPASKLAELREAASGV
jgi:hypothetical protein